MFNMVKRNDGDLKVNITDEELRKALSKTELFLDKLTDIIEGEGGCYFGEEFFDEDLLRDMWDWMNDICLALNIECKKDRQTN